MKVISKYVVPEGDLTTNVSNTDSDWSAGTYNLNDLVTHEKEIWKCVVASTTAEPGTSTDWESQGYANKWRWSDEIIGTKTTNSNTIEMTISNPTTLINGISFFGLNADTVQVKVTDSVDGEVYNSTLSLAEGDLEADWYSWFFSPFSNRQDVAFTDLPAYFGTGVDIDIVIDNTGDTAEVGEIVAGQSINLGDTVYPVNTGIITFSRKTEDANGNYSVDSKAFVKRSDYVVSLERESMAYVQRTLSGFRDVPTVYIGDEDLSSTIVYGFFKDFRLLYDNPPLATCSLSVEGLE